MSCSHLRESGEREEQLPTDLHRDAELPEEVRGGTRIAWYRMRMISGNVHRQHQTPPAVEMGQALAQVPGRTRLPGLCHMDGQRPSP